MKPRPRIREKRLMFKMRKSSGGEREQVLRHEAESAEIRGRTRQSAEVLLSQKHTRKPGTRGVMWGAPREATGEQGGDGGNRVAMGGTKGGYGEGSTKAAETRRQVSH